MIENSSEERFNPRYHITDNPDATNGPVVIDEDGNALGGNSRAMHLQRVYGRDGAGAAAYRALLEKRAGHFGIDPAAFREMRQPVLVRVISNDELTTVPGGSKWAIRKTNVSGTAQLSSSERAAADAGQLAPELVDHIAGAIEAAGQDATLNDALTGKSGTAIVNRLISEGFFSEQERPALMDGKTGALTQLAKDRISKAMLGQFFRDSDQIARTPASIKAKLERIAAPLAKLQAHPEWDLTPAIREAIDLLEFAGAHNIKNLSDVVAQENMFGGAPEWHSDAIQLAELLRDAKPNDLVAAVRRYVNDREPTMFGESTPAEAFATHFGGEKAERAPAAATLPAPEDVPRSAGPEEPPEVKRFLNAGERGSFSFKPSSGKPGVVEAILRADIKEVKELKAKRDAALAALKKAEANPAEKAFGQRMVEYYTGERDRWVSRVNQVIDRLRTLVPGPVERQGISIYRDFKGRTGELKQWLDGTHVNLKTLEPDAYKTAMERIQQLRPAILQAMHPTARMLEADKVLTQIAEASFAEGHRLGFIPRELNSERYFTHLLYPKGEGETPIPIGDRIGKALGGKIGREYAFAARREYPTVLDAIADNAKPKTLDVFDAFSIHGDKFATARATHLLIEALQRPGAGGYANGVGKWGTHSDKSVPKDWVEIAPHARLFRNDVRFTDENGEAQIAQQTLFVPKVVERALRPITDPDYMSRLPGFAALRHSQAYLKAVQLGLSFFHVTTENYMALANMGPKGWLEGLRADRQSAEFLRAEREFIAHGGTTSVLGRTVEAYKALEPGLIPTWGDIWKKAPVIREVDALAQKITDFTFGKIQRQFKVTDYSLHKAAWLAEHPQASQVETATAMSSIAKEINAVYGGLNWENVGLNHMTVEVARAVMLAPDWTISNVFNIKYALERSSAGGKLARMFWTRQLVGGIVLTEMMSLAIGHKLSKNPTQVYMGKDSNGEDIYQNLFFKGAGGDAVNLVHNVWDYGGVEGLVRTMAGKAAPFVRTGLELISNRDFLGHEVIPKGMSPLASTVRGVWEAAKGVAPTPLTLSNWKDMLVGPNADQYSVPEFFTVPFAGTPPRHVPPGGMRMTRRGLEDAPEKENQSTWDEIMTGKR